MDGLGGLQLPVALKRGPEHPLYLLVDNRDICFEPN